MRIWGSEVTAGQPGAGRQGVSRKLGASSSSGRGSWQQRGDQDRATAGTVTGPVTSVSSGARSRVGGKGTSQSSSMRLRWGMQLGRRRAGMFSWGRWRRRVIALCPVQAGWPSRLQRNPRPLGREPAGLGLTQELASSSTVHSTVQKPRCRTGAPREQVRPRGLGKGDEDDSKVCS